MAYLKSWQIYNTIKLEIGLNQRKYLTIKIYIHYVKHSNIIYFI